VLSDLTSSNGPDTRAPFEVDIFGRYARGQLVQSWRDSPRPTTPAIEAAIAGTWELERARAKLEDRILFNGKLARLLEAKTRPSSLHLELGWTCYRDFVGTNVRNAAIVLREEPAGLANPLGISVTVITRDGFMVYGRRSQRVAVHAGYMHMFGGMLEEEDRRPDGAYAVFGSALRELNEELGLRREEVSSIFISGLVRDRSLLQPELLFEVTTDLSRRDLVDRFSPQLANNEHTGIEFIEDDPEAIVPSLLRTESIAPVAQAAILIHGRHRWGDRWHGAAYKALYHEGPPPAEPT
jgi:8-oxo-dGTP pyrophosphatase MutT (NUDIX family)